MVLRYGLLESLNHRFSSNRQLIVSDNSLIRRALAGRAESALEYGVFKKGVSLRISVIEQIRDYLQRHGPASAQAVAEAIPDIEACGGLQRTLLLMRLDPHLGRTHNGLWIVRGSISGDEDRIRQAAQRFFSSIKRPGATLSSAIGYIQKETGIDPKEIREALAKCYVIHGPNIFDWRKIKEKK